MAIAAKCKKCGCHCDGEMCAFCTSQQKAIDDREAEYSQKASDGLVCPRCDCERLPVYYTRKRSGRIMRVRICDHCGTRLTTYERIA